MTCGSKLRSICVLRVDAASNVREYTILSAACQISAIVSREGFKEKTRVTGHSFTALMFTR